MVLPSASGDAAKDLADRVAQALAEISQQPHLIALDQLISAFDEARSKGWGGYNEEPASVGSFAAARSMVRFLPASFPAPDVSVQPDGYVALEWYQDRGRVFSVVVLDDTFGYAGIFDGAKVYGSEPLTSVFPEVVLEHLRRLYSGN